MGTPIASLCLGEILTNGKLKRSGKRRGKRGKREKDEMRQSI